MPVAGGVARPCNARDLQHPAALQLVQHQLGLEVRRHLLAVRLDAADEVQRGTAERRASGRGTQQLKQVQYPDSIKTFVDLCLHNKVLQMFVQCCHNS